MPTTTSISSLFVLDQHALVTMKGEQCTQANFFSCKSVGQWSPKPVQTPLIVKVLYTLILLKILQTVHKPNGQHWGCSPSCQPTPPTIPMQSLDPTYPLYSVLSFLGFVVVLIPFSWHLQAWNTGTCAYMFWVSLACLIEFVNSLVWAGNLFNPIPVWCDIGNYFFIPLHLSFVF